MSEQARTASGANLTGARRLVVQNSFSELGRVSEWLRGFARERELAPQLAYGLDLSVTEALTNIISYAYRDGTRHDIVIELREQTDRIVVAIEDDGTPFNPLEHPAEAVPRTLEESQATGRGIALMCGFADELHYVRRGGRNVLTMALLLPDRRR